MTISLLLVVLLSWARSHVSLADEMPALGASDRCATNDACRQLNERALRLYEEKRYDEAVRTLQAAYELEPMPLLLINLGRSLFRLGRYQEALDAYHRYQQVVPAPDPQNESKLQKYIAEAETALAQDRLLQAKSPPPPSAGSQVGRPLFRTWWFWTATVAAAAGIVGLGLGLGLVPQAHDTVEWKR